MNIITYLADQNPGMDRSFGISRMSHAVMQALDGNDGIRIEALTAKESQQAPGNIRTYCLPWRTQGRLRRLLTDHLHPIYSSTSCKGDLFYFPKGYLPLLHRLVRPSVVTIHDTIIQYDQDHYPSWRKSWDYSYWSWMLKHTLLHSDLVLTVSNTAKSQIQAFMNRHGIPEKEIRVTYEPCIYESTEQPVAPEKGDYVIHLASREPHKRTAHLVRWWSHAESEGHHLPMLHLIGTVPQEVCYLLASSRSIVKRPFLEEDALRAAYLGARALVFPSEIEGFGLPALEAYYQGTPVCYVRGTSVEEVLGVATARGGFSLEDPQSLHTALDDVISMSPEEVHACGMKLRATYASGLVANRMIAAFRDLLAGQQSMPS